MWPTGRTALSSRTGRTLRGRTKSAHVGHVVGDGSGANPAAGGSALSHPGSAALAERVAAVGAGAAASGIPLHYLSNMSHLPHIL
jgi:hypothetical protein